MNNRKLFTLDFLEGFLSAFDVGGTIPSNTSELLSRGLEHDMQQLLNDQKKLYEDYKKATERVIKSF